MDITVYNLPAIDMELVKILKDKRYDDLDSDTKAKIYIYVRQCQKIASLTEHVKIERINVFDGDRNSFLTIPPRDDKPSNYGRFIINLCDMENYHIQSIENGDDFETLNSNQGFLIMNSDDRILVTKDTKRFIKNYQINNKSEDGISDNRYHIRPRKYYRCTMIIYLVFDEQRSRGSSTSTSVSSSGRGLIRRPIVENSSLPNSELKSQEDHITEADSGLVLEDKKEDS